MSKVMIEHLSKYNRMERVLKYLRWMTGRGLVSSYEPDGGVLIGVIDWGPKDEDVLVYHVDVDRRTLDRVWQLPEDEDRLMWCLLELKAMSGHEEALKELVDMMVNGKHREWMSFANEWIDWAIYDWGIPLGWDGWPAEEEDNDQLRADFKDYIKERLRDGKTVWLRLARTVGEASTQG